MHRRAFLAGAATFAAAPAWAEAGSPDYLAAAKTPAGDYVLCGLSQDGEVVFRIPLPGRGHAAAAHPHRAEAVAFARRPGDFAVIIDCARGEERARLSAPKGRHFYGHGAYSADGAMLFITENAYESGEGRVGVWDTTNGYRRIGEFGSGGIGPHDVIRDGDALIVANGGIRTHPDYAREKLNVRTMRPNLSVIRDGVVADIIEAPPDLRRNSLRHLARRADGLIAVAAQWEGSRRRVVPLLALWRPGEALRFLDSPDGAAMKGYAGSVAFSGDGAQVAITSPRGGSVQVFDFKTERWQRTVAIDDVSGIAISRDGFQITSGDGWFRPLDNRERSHHSLEGLSFDNHLVSAG